MSLHVHYIIFSIMNTNISAHLSYFFTYFQASTVGRNTSSTKNRQQLDERQQLRCQQLDVGTVLNEGNKKIKSIFKAVIKQILKEGFGAQIHY